MDQFYTDRYKMKCMFTQEGVLFCNSLRDVYFPYGCLDSLNMSLLGVLQAVSHAHVCCFTPERQDKAILKELVKKARTAMKTAPSAEPVIVELASLHLEEGLSSEEKLKRMKGMYVQGLLSKEAYDLEKRLTGL